MEWQLLISVVGFVNGLSLLPCHGLNDGGSWSWEGNVCTVGCEGVPEGQELSPLSLFSLLLHVWNNCRFNGAVRERGYHGRKWLIQVCVGVCPDGQWLFREVPW